MRTWVTATMMVLLTAACASVAGGSATSSATPEREPDYDGVVEAVQPLVAPISTEGCVDRSSLPPDTPVSSADPPSCPDAGGTAPELLGSLLVEAGGPVSVSVTSATRIGYRDVGGSLVATTFDSIEVGESIAVHTDGLVRESFPPQVDAVELVLFREG